jgi:hypothetical protein
MSMIAKANKILTSSNGVVLENMLHLINWLFDFMVHFLFFCFYPISSTSLLSNNILVD